MSEDEKSIRPVVLPTSFVIGSIENNKKIAALEREKTDLKESLAKWLRVASERSDKIDEQDAQIRELKAELNRLYATDCALRDCAISAIREGVEKLSIACESEEEAMGYNQCQKDVKELIKKIEGDEK